jgi:hypothetical protein
MAQYIASRRDAEVSGHSAASFLNASGSFEPMIRKVLAEHGILRFGSEDWLPMQSWLDALREVALTIGENTLFTVGKRIPSVVSWPSAPSTIEAGLASVDAAYHMNHRVDGEVLFDQETGDMRDGIGHYSFWSGGVRRAVMVCNSPYPSEFDRGIITGLARRFKPAVTVLLDESHPTRKCGADTCTYTIRW